MKSQECFISITSSIFQWSNIGNLHSTLSTYPLYHSRCDVYSILFHFSLHPLLPFLFHSIWDNLHLIHSFIDGKLLDQYPFYLDPILLREKELYWWKESYPEKKRQIDRPTEKRQFTLAERAIDGEKKRRKYEEFSKRRRSLPIHYGPK